jgi:DNA-3-methyladenine glycosylase
MTDPGVAHGEEGGGADETERPDPGGCVTERSSGRRVAAGSRFADGFFRRGAEAVAADLLGSRLISTVDGVRCVGVVVETEAYFGAEDPASHAATRRGLTPRNAPMFGPPGRAYVYLSHGLHWCLNVVTGDEGDPQAVLLRALDPLEGLNPMSIRRGGRRPLASGPGRLCQAMGVTGTLNGQSLTVGPVRLLPGRPVGDDEIGVSGRVGVSAAADWPLRFFVKSNVEVSGPKGARCLGREALSVS